MDPQARARINSALIAIFFTGGAIGSEVGSLAYRAAGWSVLCVFGGPLSVAALLHWLTERKTATAPESEAGCA